MRKLLALLFCWFVAGTLLWAAENQPAEDSTGQESVLPAEEATVDGSETDSEAEAEEESDARFIPTEEISQDLGVSFPVDI